MANKVFDRTIPTEEEAKKRIDFLYEKSFEKSSVTDSQVIAGVSEKLIKDLRKKNIEIDNTFRHSISDTQIHHSLKHSAAEKEAKLNQLPITKTDFNRILTILKDYDSIRLGVNNRKLNSITYAKLFPDGKIIYIEEIRTGRKTLSFNTMYKKDCYGGLS